MVIKVKLKGLKIAHSRGKYYVYVRATGDILLKGFEGNKEELEHRLAMPDMLGAYNIRRKRENQTYPDKTLGKLVHWFTIGDISRTKEQRKVEDRFDSEGYPKWKKLAKATREDYLDAFEYLQDEFDSPLSIITQHDLYKIRDKCGQQKGTRFADKLIRALSSMFSQGAKRGDMLSNPCLGMDQAHTADPNANREWGIDEWLDAIDRAKNNQEILTPLMLARYAGFRGQTIAVLQWKKYLPDPKFGKCFRHVAKKNDEKSWVPVVPELQAYLDGLDRTALQIATRNDGTPWKDEKHMQTSVSHFLRSIQDSSAVEPGATLHGLRVSFAAELGAGGASDGDVAAALGDKSERMGKHYTRHVKNEGKVIRAFEAKRKS